MNREAVTACIAEGVLIYQGKIDKHLFQAEAVQSSRPGVRALAASTRSSLTRGPVRAPVTQNGATCGRPCAPGAFDFGLSAAFLGREDEAFAAATLAFSASMRSTAGAGSATGSGAAISSPRTAPSGVRRSRR